MDSPYESRRQRLAGLVANRRAAPGSDPQAQEQLTTDPDWIVLTEDDRLNGLGLFTAESPQIEPPKLEQHREFESVPAYRDRIDLPRPTLEHAAPPVTAPSSEFAHMAGTTSGSHARSGCRGLRRRIRPHDGHHR